MAGINKVILVGHLGRDPEMRYTQGGTPVVNLSVATTRKWRNKHTNELVEETEWHRITVFGQSAEHCNNYLATGRQVYIEGRLRTRSYDKEGQKHYATEIIADTVQFLGGRNAGGGGGGNSRTSDSAHESPRRSRHQASSRRQTESESDPYPYDPGAYSPSSNDDDDIPF